MEIKEFWDRWPKCGRVEKNSDKIKKLKKSTKVEYKL